MNRLLRFLLLFLLVALSVFSFYACHEDGLTPISNNLEFNEQLSAYEIFQDNAADLVPSERYHLYVLTTELFTDYAEKQRLIKIPTGTKVISNDGGLPQFPDGTVIVKTFYYFNDARDESKGKRIIETRLLIKSGGKWNAATYLWNNEQTDANLITTGINTTVNWIDAHGKGRIISYHVPSNRECSTCHHSSGDITPIGPKLRNLNKQVVRNEGVVNQLSHLHNVGILESVDPTLIPTLPDWQDNTFSLHERGRAYLDVNCAHCHNSKGTASDTNVDFDYSTSYSGSNIGDKKRSIVNKMETGEMPRIGASIVHDEGLALIRSYINSL